MTDPCVFCKSAEVEPDYPCYHANCVGCGTRALAQSPMYHGSAQRGRLGDEYRVALGRLFGDGIEAGRLLVKAEATRIREARAAR